MERAFDKFLAVLDHIGHYVIDSEAGAFELLRAERLAYCLFNLLDCLFADSFFRRDNDATFLRGAFEAFKKIALDVEVIKVRIGNEWV